jgi:lactoylglutathione lyase
MSWNGVETSSNPVLERKDWPVKLNASVMPMQQRSRMDATMPSESNLQQAVPFLAVSNMENSLRFYVDGLGFAIADSWVEEGTVRWCKLRRGGAALMLQDFRRDGREFWSPDGPLGLGVSIVFICDDALSIYREFIARGLTPAVPFVGNGMWVTSLRDPDGYSVEFESQTDVPEDTMFNDRATDVTA